MTLHRHPDSPLLDHCPPTLPAQAYLSPDWFANEQRAIWAREWVCVGRLNDLPSLLMRPVTVAGERLFLIREPDQTVRCFHNTCRHRGSELCAADRALRAKLITCPYHQWAYDLSGHLVSTAFGTPSGDFRREDHGLFAAHTRVWNGFIYVCLADQPPDLAPDGGLHSLDNWPMADLITGHVLEKDLACNWKVFWENYNECLHCPGIHPELCDMVPVYRQGIMSAGEAGDWTPDTTPAPVLKAGAVTWTPTGQPCGPEFPGLTAAERTAGHTFITLLPGQFIVAHVDYVRSVCLTPTSPTTTRLRAEWLFPAETLAQPGFDTAEVAAFATTVLLQDAAACEMNQRGLTSSKYQSGRLMPQEFDLARFHTWVKTRLEAAS